MTKQTTAAQRAKRKETGRLSSRAHYAAVKRLIAMYPDAWERLYGEEAARLGITPHFAGAAERAAKLREQLAKLEEKYGV